MTARADHGAPAINDNEVSPLQVATAPVVQRSPDVHPCAWCGVAGIRATSRFCSKKCRQTAFRVRRRAGVVDSSSNFHLPSFTTSGRFAYADPPYPGLAHYYRDQPTYGGEVDHVALIASLVDARYDGWALSTSAAALVHVLPLCPVGARVCSWVKPIGVSSLTWGAHNTWEPLIVVGGRPCRPGIRDWLRAMPARGGGTLLGRKPIAFCAWMFDLLGMSTVTRAVEGVGFYCSYTITVVAPAAGDRFPWSELAALYG